MLSSDTKKVSKAQGIKVLLSARQGDFNKALYTDIMSAT
jgi:hypothetical protein